VAAVGVARLGGALVVVLVAVENTTNAATAAVAAVGAVRVVRGCAGREGVARLGRSIVAGLLVVGVAALVGIAGLVVTVASSGGDIGVADAWLGVVAAWHRAVSAVVVTGSGRGHASRAGVLVTADVAALGPLSPPGQLVAMKVSMAQRTWSSRGLPVSLSMIPMMACECVRGSEEWWWMKNPKAAVRRGRDPACA
jgi:hypothetical protein